MMNHYATLFAGLMCNGNRVTNKLLENVKLSVKLKTEDGIDVNKTFNNFQLYDEKESVSTFTVPNETRSISIRLDAEVKNMSQNIKQSLSKSTDFRINSYIVALYGKNGK